MNSIKRIFAVIFAAAAVILTQTAVFAYEVGYTGIGTKACPYTVTTADGLKACVENGGYINLGADIELPSSGYTFSVEKAVVLDLCGYDIVSSSNIFYLQKNTGSLVVNDSSTDKSGSISTSGSGYVVFACLKGSLTVNGGSFYSSSTHTITISETANVTVNDGYFKKNEGTTSTVYVHGAATTGSLTINGGTFEINSNGDSLECNNPGSAFKMEINGGIFNKIWINDNKNANIKINELTVYNRLISNDKDWSEYFDSASVVKIDGDARATSSLEKSIHGDVIQITNYRNIKIMEQPPKTVYFETYNNANIPLRAEGREKNYSWYFKTPDRTDFLLDEEFDDTNWTGSYEFRGLTTNGLTAKYDGTEMYCKVWNWYGCEVESEHFILKAYQYDVDRNITIVMPKVGQTFKEYVSNAKNIVPKELLIDWDSFDIIVRDKDGKYIKQPNGHYYMDDDTVFKAEHKYEFCFKMYLPEYVSPLVINWFYSKGLIVNGTENGAADHLDDKELYFADFWTTPVLENDGDVNIDKKTDKNDAALLLKYISGTAALTDNRLVHADMNGDDNYDMLDVIAILNKVKK